jgi:hypothetical protein
MYTNSRAPVALLLSVFLAGCAAPPPLPKPALDQPSNPDAPQAAPIAASNTLALPPAIEPTTAPATAKVPPATGESMPGMRHMGHDMGHDTGSMPGMKHDASASQSATTPSATTQAAVLYTCTMHPDIVSDHPGKCPKCGMKLVRKGAGQ